MSQKHSHASGLLSLADISRHFDLPESTTRYYCKRFAAYLPIHGEGRRRRYGEQSLEIVATILENMKAGKNANAVEKELAQNYAKTADIYVPAVKEASAPQNINNAPMDASLAMKLLEQQSNAMQSIAHSLSILASQQEQMQNLTTAAKEATEENIELRKEVATLKTVIRSREDVYQDDLDQVRHWMSRLARSYNEKTPLDTQIPQSEKD